MYGGPIHNPAFIRRIIGYLPGLDSGTYNTLARLEGMLHTALEEAPSESDIVNQLKNADETNCVEAIIPRLDPIAVDNQPFFFNPSLLAKVLHTQSPPEVAIKGALRNGGYFATRSHAKPGSVKTNAPWSFIWHMMCEWVRQKAYDRNGILKEGMPGWKIAIKASADRGLAKEEGPVAITDAKILISEREKESVPKVIFDESLGKQDPIRKKLRRYQMNPRPYWGPMSKAKSETP